MGPSVNPNALLEYFVRKLENLKLYDIEPVKSNPI
jgi:hypothetical protein